jgi:hypothetical protein
MRGDRRRWVLSALVLGALSLAVAAVSLGGAPAAPLQAHEVTTATVPSLPAIRTPAAAAATWCGTATGVDLTPNVVAGNPVHWIYAIPSDGTDRLSTFASVMQTDAEAIDAWWRREDPTRVPRNDLTQLSCGVQLDLTSLRFPLSGSQLASDAGFGAIFNALVAGAFRSPFTKYVVYFDGPVSDDRICGRGGSDSSGIGLAVVYVQACAGVSTAAVAAHELLHTYGAVPNGAPHNCPEPDDGHTCDAPSDLMYPFIDGSLLESKTLDPGRDDYYGHSGTITDTQDTPWLVQLDRQVPLQVNVAGPGAVAADVPGLSCAQSCSTTWNGDTRLNLTPVPTGATKLVRWSGACSGASACNVGVTPGATVSALFAPLVYRLTVAVQGRGSVRASRAGITCRPRCSASFPSYVPVQLTATPAKGWKLRSWAGACRGKKRTCTVPMSAATSARAVFVRA